MKKDNEPKEETRRISPTWNAKKAPMENVLQNQLDRARKENQIYKQFLYQIAKEGIAIYEDEPVIVVSADSTKEDPSQIVKIAKEKHYMNKWVKDKAFETLQEATNQNL